jgi:hypothetical protein
MKVQNLTSSKGNIIANQFEIRTETARYFQSYESIIVKIENGTTYLDGFYWNYSRTTSKYRNFFLGLNTKETLNKIKNGTFILIDLNNSYNK